MECINGNKTFILDSHRPFICSSGWSVIRKAGKFRKARLVGGRRLMNVDRVPGFLYIYSSELAPPPPHPQASVVLLPFRYGGGGGAHTLAGEGGGGAHCYEGTDTHGTLGIV